MGSACSTGTRQSQEQKRSSVTESVHSVFGKDHDITRKHHSWPDTFLTKLEAGLTTKRRPGWSTLLYLGMIDVRTLAELAPHNLSVLRELTEAASICGEAMIPSDVSKQTVDADGVRCVWAWPKCFRGAKDAPAQLLYCHGGAFCLGSPETHLQLICKIAEIAQCAVLAPDYRRCPEATIAQAVEDALKAYRYLIQHSAPHTSIVVGGESAGANLAVQLALRLRAGQPALPQAQALALMSPWVNLHDSIEQSRSSWGENEDSDFVLGKLARTFAVWVLGAEQVGGVEDPMSKEAQAMFESLDDETLLEIASREDVSPALAKQLAGLPPTLISTGGCETLRDSQLEFAERLKSASVVVECKVFDDMPHAVALASFVADEGSGSGPMDIVKHYADFVSRACRTGILRDAPMSSRSTASHISASTEQGGGLGGLLNCGSACHRV